MLLPPYRYIFLFTFLHFFCVRECGADVDRCSFPPFFFISRDGGRTGRARVSMSYHRITKCHWQYSTSGFQSFQSLSIPCIEKKNFNSLIINIRHISLSVNTFCVLYLPTIHSRPSSSKLPQSWHAHLVIDLSTPCAFLPLPLTLPPRNF